MQPKHGKHIFLPEGHVIISKEKLEALQEAAFKYDQLNDAIDDAQDTVQDEGLSESQSHEAARAEGFLAGGDS